MLYLSEILKLLKYLQFDIKKKKEKKTLKVTFISLASQHCLNTDIKKHKVSQKMANWIHLKHMTFQCHKNNSYFR